MQVKTLESMRNGKKPIHVHWIKTNQENKEKIKTKTTTKNIHYCIVIISWIQSLFKEEVYQGKFQVGGRGLNSLGYGPGFPSIETPT